MKVCVSSEIKKIINIFWMRMYLKIHVTQQKNVGIFRLYNNQYDLIQFKWVHQTGKFRLFESCNSLQDYFEQILTPPHSFWSHLHSVLWKFMLIWRLNLRHNFYFGISMWSCRKLIAFALAWRFSLTLKIVSNTICHLQFVYLGKII